MACEQIEIDGTPVIDLDMTRGSVVVDLDLTGPDVEAGRQAIECDLASSTVVVEVPQGVAGPPGPQGPEGAPGVGVTATEQGQIVIAVDNTTIETRKPLTGETGWIVNDAGELLWI